MGVVARPFSTRVLEAGALSTQQVPRQLGCTEKPRVGGKGRLFPEAKLIADGWHFKRAAGWESGA